MPLGWLDLPRVPEPEVMEESGEVEAYASAAAQAWLDHIDNAFVEHALGLGVRSGRALDIGTGPGRIPIKLAGWLPGIEVVGIDRSANMLKQGGGRTPRSASCARSAASPSPGAPCSSGDLRRPSRPSVGWHLWRHGRHYSGRMAVPLVKRDLPDSSRRHLMVEGVRPPVPR